MPLIEGVGDEVIQFLGVVLVVVVGALAWFSTNARPDRYRTVLVMRSRPHHPVTLSIRTRSNLMVTSSSTNSSTQASTPAETGTATPSVSSEENRESARVIPLQEMDSIVDADMAMLDHNRLHFYRRMDSGNSSPSTTETSIEALAEQAPASTAQIREMDSIVSAMEGEVSTTCDLFASPAESNPEPTKPEPITIDNKTNSENESNSKPGDNTIENASGDQGTSADNVDGGSRRKILIRLKYLNDTLKEVEGCLDELLKDFKLRHFSSELSSESRVRLIFNGRVLVDEAATLRACGLHHKAVVHCLVHPKRNSQPGLSPPMTPLQAELVSEPPPERAWDLENILMTLVSVALTVVWFFRCEYSNMFTASASVALFGLTVFYSVAIFGLYLNDTFHFDRRPAQAQPVPDN